MTYSGMGFSRLGASAGAKLLFALGAGAVGVAACGDIEVARFDSARDRAASEIAESFCSAAAPCCARLELPEPAAGCEREIRNQVMIALIRAEDAERELVPSAVDDCAEAFALTAASELDCSALPSASEVETLCPGLFTAPPEGVLLPGSVCESVADCASPKEPGVRACNKVGFQPTGVCHWVLARGVDEPCEANPNIASCQEGLSCAPSEGGLVCTTPPAGFEACIPGVTQCMPGLDCTDHLGESVCMQLEGAECTVSVMPCAGGFLCENGYCVRPPATCVEGTCPTPAFDKICR